MRLCSGFLQQMNRTRSIAEWRRRLTGGGPFSIGKKSRSSAFGFQSQRYAQSRIHARERPSFLPIRGAVKLGKVHAWPTGPNLPHSPKGAARGARKKGGGNSPEKSRKMLSRQRKFFPLRHLAATISVSSFRPSLIAIERNGDVDCFSYSASLGGTESARL